jgi:hypothetical protein
MSQRPQTLFDRLRQTLRLKHYSIHTEEAYLDWVRRFILFHHKRHPRTMGGPEIEAFLTYLAVERKVAASTVRLSSRRSPEPGLQRAPISIPARPQPGPGDAP